MYEVFEDKPVTAGGIILMDSWTLHQAIEKLNVYVPVSATDKYAEGYRDGLACARRILGEMMVE